MLIFFSFVLSCVLFGITCWLGYITYSHGEYVAFWSWCAAASMTLILNLIKEFDKK